jgi:GTP-binding protein
MLRPLTDVRFLKSATDVSQLGACHAEVAFVGRSNVGKSSLLNALARRKKLARVSQTPGRTREVNVFLTGQDRWIVDLPGYGYAKGPAKERSEWQGMLEGYLTTRETLRVIFVLVDAEVGPTPLDHQMIEWLQSIGRDYRVVAAKSDRVKAGRQLARRGDIAAALGLAAPNIAWVSSSTGTGIDELRREVAEILELR